MANRPKPIKLPGSFDEAVSDLLKVKPPAKPDRKSVQTSARKTRPGRPPKHG
jgi:hypothetical protein